ncbi:MAG: glycosyltransferase family 39 protein [Anaerolineales bacterium]|nr:glycosyltransferase family 39 protein [Anaerolineales bacterium]
MAKVKEQNILESTPQRLIPADKSLAAFLALLLFGLYMFTFDGTLHSTDGLAMFAVTENLVKHVQFDIRQLENWENVTLGVDGKPYTVFPIGPTLFMLPLFALALVFPGLGLTQTTMILMPLCSALSAAYLYLIARRLGYSPGISVVTSLLAGLGTMTWLRTRDLVADPLILLGFTATLYYALAYRQDQKLGYAALMGLSLGFTVLNKVINATTVPFFLWYLVVPGFDVFRFKKFHWRAGFITVLPVVAAILITGIYNELRFGSYFDSGFRGPITFSTPAWIGFIGVIISPYKSLLLYVPLFLLIPFVIKETWQKHSREVILILAILFSQMLLFGAWHDWGGGKNWGPRYLVPLNGLLTVLLLPFIERAFQSNHWRQGAILIIFGLMSLLMQILGLSARDDPFLGAANFWTPPPHLSFWGELRWDNPAQWPIWGHLLLFDLRNIPVIWRWEWAGITHFALTPFLVTWLIIFLGLVGIVTIIRRGQDSKGSILLKTWFFMGTWLIALAGTAIILWASYPDPRSIKDPKEAAELWPAYQQLMTQLPTLVTPNDALIFTDRRLEFYLLDTDKSAAQRYVLAKPTQPLILETIPKLLQEQAGKQGRVWLVTDPLDNRQLAYATQLWLQAHAAPTESYIFGDSVRLSAFESLPSNGPWEPIPPEPPLTVLVAPDDYKFHRIAALLGWNWPDLNPDAPASFQTGQTYRFELFWVYYGKAPEDTFFVRLLDSTRRPVSEAWLSPQPENGIIDGQLMMEKGAVLIPAELAPGLYHLQLGFSTSAVEAGELIFDLPTELTKIRVIHKNS